MSAPNPSPEQVAAEALREWQRNTPAVMRSSPTTVWIDRAEQPASVVVAALREHGYLAEPSPEDGPSAELRHHIAYRPVDRDEDVCLECSSFEDGLYVPWPCSLVRMARAGTSPDTDDLRERLREAVRPWLYWPTTNRADDIAGVVLAFAAEQSEKAAREALHGAADELRRQGSSFRSYQNAEQVQEVAKWLRGLSESVVEVGRDDERDAS